MTALTRFGAGILAVAACLGLASAVSGCSGQPAVNLSVAAPPPAATRDATLTLAGQVEPASTRLSVRIGPGAWSPVPSKNGDFTYLATLRPGKNTILLRAGDRGGSGAVDRTYVVTYSPKVPLSWALPADGASISGSSVSVEGSTTPGAVVTLNDATVTVGSDGVFGTTVALKPGATRLALHVTATGYPARDEVRVVTRAESPAAFKASCRAVSAKKLIADPQSYGGQRITVSGRVSEIRKNNPGVTLAIDLAGGTTLTPDRVLADFLGDTTVHVGARVQIWGVGHGIAAFGADERTYPTITATYVSVR